MGGWGLGQAGWGLDQPLRGSISLRGREQEWEWLRDTPCEGVTVGEGSGPRGLFPRAGAAVAFLLAPGREASAGSVLAATSCMCQTQECSHERDMCQTGVQAQAHAGLVTEQGKLQPCSVLPEKRAGGGGRGDAGTYPGSSWTWGNLPASPQSSPQSSHTCPTQSGPVASGWGAAGRDCLAGVLGNRNRLDWAFQARGLRVFLSPDNQGMALSCSREWLPPAPGEGRKGEPGALNLGPGKEEGGTFTLLTLVASPIWGLSQSGWDHCSGDRVG